MNTADIQIGDIVFIRCGAALLRKVADATSCWSNHVGVVIAHDKGDWIVAESRVPFSTTTTLQRFIARSEHSRYAIRRPRSLSIEEQARLRESALRRMGILYHWGFNLRSSRQFCSKFVHEVFQDALGIKLGKVETFGELLQNNPQVNQRFWRIWYFGAIPWQRETITPTSLYLCPRLTTVLESTH